LHNDNIFEIEQKSKFTTVIW